MMEWESTAREARFKDSAQRQGGDLAQRAAAGVLFLPAPAATPSLGNVFPPRPRAAVASAFCPSSTPNLPVMVARSTNPPPSRVFWGGADGKAAHHAQCFAARRDAP
jgi:hypothetical protein